MVPAPGSQRQSQQMVPRKPSSSSSSSSLLEILRGWLLRDRQEQIPIFPCPIPTGVWVLSLQDSSAWCQENAAPLGVSTSASVCPACHSCQEP